LTASAIVCLRTRASSASPETVMPSDLTNGNTLACGGLDLTAEGTALHQSLRDYIAIPRERLLGQFDEGDIETTVRTLQAISERALAG